MAVVVAPGEGERLAHHIRLKLELPELSVNEVVVGPEFEGAGPHYHERHVDSFYVLEGELELTVGTETLRAGAGTSVAIPPGIVHSFTSSGPATTRYLNMHAPDAGFIEYLRRRAAGDASAGFDSIGVDAPSGPAEADVVADGGGERLEHAIRTIAIRAARPELCFLQFDARPGFGPIDPHRHDAQVDSFYVLEGELDLVADGREQRLQPGTFVAAAPGEEHGILEVETPLRFLNFHAPDDGFAEFIRSQ
ncbi:MAG: cupin domain-containing protein [Actinomycetota bacterium]|nr:cupin domain-containing protein [Actinomycetota bacterium]